MTREIAGWAWERRHPSEPINVVIYDGTNPLATVAANLERTDLAQRCNGEVNHGFVYPVPKALWDGREHTISVKAEKGGFELDGSPKKYRFKIR